MRRYIFGRLVFLGVSVIVLHLIETIIAQAVSQFAASSCSSNKVSATAMQCPGEALTFTVIIPYIFSGLYIAAGIALLLDLYQSHRTAKRQVAPSIVSTKHSDSALRIHRVSSYPVAIKCGRS